MIQRDSAITLATLGKVEFPIYSLYPSYPFFPSRHSFHVFELIRYLSLLLEHSYLNTLTPAGLHQITSCCCNFLQILWSHEPDSVRSTIPSLDYYQQMCVLSELASEQSNEVKSIDRILTQLLKLFEKQESETGEIPKEPSFLVNVPTDPFDRAMYIQLCQIISVIEMDSESIRTIRLYTSNKQRVVRILVRFLHYLEERKSCNDSYQLAITLLTTSYLDSRGYVWTVFCYSYQQLFGDHGMIDLLQTALQTVERD